MAHADEVDSGNQFEPRGVNTYGPGDREFECLGPPRSNRPLCGRSLCHQIRPPLAPEVSLRSTPPVVPKYLKAHTEFQSGYADFPGAQDWIRRQVSTSRLECRWTPNTHRVVPSFKVARRLDRFPIDLKRALQET